MKMKARSLAALLICLLAVQAQADDGKVYRYVDEHGVVHYSDKPPREDAKPIELPKLRTYTPGALPETRPAATAQARASAPAALAPYRELRIVTPEPEETIRGAERLVPVAVVCEPGLDPAHRVQFYLDGAPQGAAKNGTATVFNGVERGTHTVSAAIVDGGGQTLIRAQPVTIYMKPPIVR